MTETDARTESEATLRSRTFHDDIGFLVRAGKHAHDIERDAISRQPLTAPQFAILLAATRAPGSDQASIARLAALDPSTTSEVIRRLIRQRKVAVKKDPRDARRSLIYASDAAASLVEGYLSNVRQSDDRIIGLLPPHDRAPFLESLAAMAGRNLARTADQAQFELAESETRLAFGRLVRIALGEYTTAWRAKNEHAPLVDEFLRLVRDTPGISQNLAGRVLLLDRATTAGLVSRLTELGFVSGRQSDVDRRRKELSLTSPGRDELTAMADSRREIERAYFAPLTPAQESSVLDGLRIIAASISEPGAGR